jgi:hypothetical protein
MSFLSGSSHPIVLLIVLVAVTLIVYCQVGWMLTSAWNEKNPNGWDNDCRVIGAIFWPFLCLFFYLVLPACLAFLRIVTAPQALVEWRRGSKERQADKARKRKEDEQVKAAADEARRALEISISPSAEIDRINSEMIKLATRRTELERRPDASRH